MGELVLRFGDFVLLDRMPGGNGGRYGAGMVALFGGRASHRRDAFRYALSGCDEMGALPGVGERGGGRAILYGAGTEIEI